MKSPLLAGTLTAAVLLAGCSSPTTSPTSAPSSGASSPAASASAKPSSSSTSAAGTGAAAAVDQAKPGDKVDAKALSDAMVAGQESVKTAVTTMKSKGKVQGVDVDLDTNAQVDMSDRNRVKMHLTLSKMNVEAIMDGKDMYVKMPLLGEGWYKGTEADLGADGMGQMPTADQMTGQAQQLADSIREASFVGEETIDGVQTRHYKLMVERDKIVDKAASAIPSASASASSTSSASALVPVDVWLDDKHVTRRSSSSIDGSTTQVDVSKVNEPVSITIPTDAKPFPR